MTHAHGFKIKIFADGADAAVMKRAYERGVVKGFTTNPTLLRKAGVSDYNAFAVQVLKDIPDLPISFEVFADDFPAMEKEARTIGGWGKNVFVKIPVTNSKGESSIPLIQKLSRKGLSLNITALLTVEQVEAVAGALSRGANSIVSVFAGRIADTGRDPVPIMQKAADLLRPNPKAELLWASSRELFNIMQAELCGCHIITVTDDILRKLPMINRDLTELSLDTVRMFREDAVKTGYLL